MTTHGWGCAPAHERLGCGGRTQGAGAGGGRDERVLGIVQVKAGHRRSGAGVAGSMPSDANDPRHTLLQLNLPMHLLPPLLQLNVLRLMPPVKGRVGHMHACVSVCRARGAWMKRPDARRKVRLAGGPSVRQAAAARRCNLLGRRGKRCPADVEKLLLLLRLHLVVLLRRPAAVIK